MSQQSVPASLVFGICILLGLLGLGLLLGNAAIDFKQLDRSVTVKGLSEREYPADVVIWPIQFTGASNDLGALYEQVDGNAAKIKAFLVSKGIAESEISYGAPSIVDKSANQYGGGPRPEFRYSATQAVTVYSENITAVRDTMSALSELGREGIVFTGGNYDAQTEYLFTSLNEVKPEMVEEATRKAREVAEKFAEDSESRLGKIKRASQGQFSIRPRDRNNPHIKVIRVVSTVEYYLSD
jgi:hypothetical protein